MSDPYVILGVSRSSSDDEIRIAYRELAQKYSSESYEGNPLSDIAQQKMQEINDAYDQIMADRRLSDRQNTQRSSSGGNPSGRYTDIRRMINSGDITGAENRLQSIEPSMRTAEWNFLMGSLNYRRGWLDEAKIYYQRAVNMAPNNAEYRQALNFVNMGGAAYRPSGYEQTGLDACDICAGLMCLNMCCNIQLRPDSLFFLGDGCQRIYVFLQVVGHVGKCISQSFQLVPGFYIDLKRPEVILHLRINNGRGCLCQLFNRLNHAKTNDNKEPENEQQQYNHGQAGNQQRIPQNIGIDHIHGNVHTGKCHGVSVGIQNSHIGRGQISVTVNIIPCN